MPLYNNTVYITSIIVRGIAVGFPSPANDYVERRLTVDDICQNDANCLTIQTSTGYAVVNRSLRPKQRNLVLISFCGRTHFARIMGGALITDDGEAIEGDALDDVTVMGVVTYLINSALNEVTDELPLIPRHMFKTNKGIDSEGSYHPLCSERIRSGHIQSR